MRAERHAWWGVSHAVERCVRFMPHLNDVARHAASRTQPRPALPLLTSRSGAAGVPGDGPYRLRPAGTPPTGTPPAATPTTRAATAPAV